MAPISLNDLRGYFFMGIRAEACREEVRKHYIGADAQTYAAKLLLDTAAQIDQKREAIRAAINGIPDETAREIIELRYIERKEWAEICGDVGYEQSQAYVFHKRGLKALQKAK